MTETRWKLLVLSLMGGFVLMAFEVRSMHEYVIPKNPQGWIPVVASWLGVLLCLALIAARPKTAKVAMVGFLAIAGAGGFGAYRHSEGRMEPFMSTISVTIPALKPKGQHEPAPGPPLAPLALCGLGLIGLIASTNEKR